MKYPLILLAIALTVFCWGIYGPVLHKGQLAMGGSRLRPLICVGLAYFVIAVLVPGAILYLRGEPGELTSKGVFWSLAGGAAGAIGALGIILAFNFGGRPNYVMPLVFGCAPVINAFFSIYMARQWGEMRPAFLAGLIMVAMGAFMVLWFAPRPHSAGKTAHHKTGPAVDRAGT